MTIRLNDGLPDDALNDTATTLTLLQTRRSASAKAMRAPGPTPDQLDMLMEIAVRVPDHGKLTPWRFILFEGDGRAAAGKVLAERWHELNPGHGEAVLGEQAGMFLRAPVVLGVISKAGEHPKIPIWEQELSAGAVCQNILVGCTAMGIGCQWITGWYAYDRAVLKRFGISEDEKVAGFIYMGTSTQNSGDRPRPEPQDLLTRWSADS